MTKNKPVLQPVEPVPQILPDVTYVNIGTEKAEELAKQVESTISQPEPPVEPPPPPARDKMVRVRNQGAPFACDLTVYGYGMRWPTNAIYNIPMSKYMELLAQGFNGTHA